MWQVSGLHVKLLVFICCCKCSSAWGDYEISVAMIKSNAYVQVVWSLLEHDAVGSRANQHLSYFGIDTRWNKITRTMLDFGLTYWVTLNETRCTLKQFVSVPWFLGCHDHSLCFLSFFLSFFLVWPVVLPAKSVRCEFNGRRKPLDGNVSVWLCDWQSHNHRSHYWHCTLYSCTVELCGSDHQSRQMTLQFQPWTYHPGCKQGDCILPSLAHLLCRCIVNSFRAPLHLSGKFSLCSTRTWGDHSVEPWCS